MFNGTAYDRPQYYTQAEVRDIVAYAEDLFIEVVPEVDVPAHTAALIVAARQAKVPLDLGTLQLNEGCQYPGGPAALRGAPNCMGGTHGIVLPTNATLEFLKGVLTEIFDLFPFEFIHLGGDEAGQFRDAAYDSAEGQALKRDLGIGNNARLQVAVCVRGV